MIQILSKAARLSKGTKDRDLASGEEWEGVSECGTKSVGAEARKLISSTVSFTTYESLHK